jgi:Fe-S-cluster-containing dehydrogenase component/CRP-like cAMP-binding protein
MGKVTGEKDRELQEQFEDRWSVLGRHTGILKISKRLSAGELRKFDIFADFDDRLLEKMSPDISVAVWDRQKILFEEGSYIDLAFYIAKGHVNIHVQKQRGRGAWINGANGRMSKNRQEKTVFETQVSALKKKKNITFLTSMDIDLPWGEVLNLGEGDIFGEIGASVGWPQTVTAQTTSECVLVQIRLPALDKMKRRSKAFKARLDRLYVERSLSGQLRSYPFFQKCSDAFLDALKERLALQSFHGGEVITREGEVAGAVYLIRSGFVKLLQKFGDGELVVYYLSKGMMLGDIEFLVKQPQWVFTAVSVEHTELVKIAPEDFKTVIDDYPEIQKPLWDAAFLRIERANFNKKNIGSSEFIDTALETGLVEGTSVLAIDLDTCTRCDDCVRGCADSHGGAPKFVREGEKYRDFLITRACYHCQDPVCLIGCPTGAIRRAGIGDVVEIDEELCIGCKVCFNNCPYNAITMVEQENGAGRVARVDKKGREKVQELATKCDLCQNTGHDPACVSNCPHSSAIRVRNTEDFSRLLFRNNKDRRGWQSFRIRKLVQSFAWFYAFLAAALLCVLTYIVNAAVSEIGPGNVWGLGYGTAAAILMLGAALYGVRRRVAGPALRRGLGSAFHWLQFHLYGGVLFALLVLMHTGFKIPDGTLYLWLWALSLWVTVSGLAGIFIQKWVPTMLSSALSVEVIYERIPELIQEIRKNAETLVLECSEPVKDFYRKQIVRSLKGPEPKPIYFVDITGGIQRRLKQFAFLKRVLSSEESEKLGKLELLYKSKLEMDAHYTLQKLLRRWLYIHLPASIVLLVLVAIHLYAVFYY